MLTTNTWRFQLNKEEDERRTNSGKKERIKQQQYHHKIRSLTAQLDG